MKQENRGRPADNIVRITKWELITKSYTGEESMYKFDLNKNPQGGMISCEIKKHPNKPELPDLNPKQKYNNSPVVLVFATSNRSNAKTKIKIFNNKNVDHVLTNDLPGVPDNAVILEVGVGKTFIDNFKHKYKL